MAAPLYPTKGELRSELLIRLGYGGLGPAAANFVPMADSLLEEAQAMLYEVFTDEKGFRTWTGNIGVGQRWLSIPTECDVDTITEIAINRYGVGSTEDWYPLTRGINSNDDSHYDEWLDHPRKYDIRYNDAASETQIEIWPKTDVIYPYKIEGPMVLGAFVADADRASFPRHLVLLYAVAHGKSHLNKPDAARAMESWNAFLTKQKAKQHNGKRYIRRSPRERQACYTPKPPRVV